MEGQEEASQDVEVRDTCLPRDTHASHIEVDRSLDRTAVLRYELLARLGHSLDLGQVRCGGTLEEHVPEIVRAAHHHHQYPGMSWPCGIGER